MQVMGSMAKQQSIYIKLFAILVTWPAVCRACMSMFMHKLTKGPQLYQQRLANGGEERSMWFCTKWCWETDACVAFTWTSGYCAEVGPTIQPITIDSIVYILDKNNGRAPGKSSAIT